jgi:hypothetical protein
MMERGSDLLVRVLLSFGASAAGSCGRCVRRLCLESAPDFTVEECKLSGVGEEELAFELMLQSSLCRRQEGTLLSRNGVEGGSAVLAVSRVLLLLCCCGSALSAPSETVFGSDEGLLLEDNAVVAADLLDGEPTYVSSVGEVPASPLSRLPLSVPAPTAPGAVAAPCTGTRGGREGLWQIPRRGLSEPLVTRCAATKAA